MNIFFKKNSVLQLIPLKKDYQYFTEKS